MGWVSGWVLPGCGVPSLHPPPSPALPEGQGRLCRIKRGKMVLYKGVNKAGLCKGAAPEAPTLSSRRPPAAGYSWGGTLVRTPSPLGAVVWGGGGGRCWEGPASVPSLSPPWQSHPSCPSPDPALLSHPALRLPLFEV